MRGSQGENNAAVLKEIAASEHPEIQALAERPEVVAFIEGLESDPDNLSAGANLGCLNSGSLLAYLYCIAFGLSLPQIVLRGEPMTEEQVSRFRERWGQLTSHLLSQPIVRVYDPSATIPRASDVEKKT